MLPYVDVLLPLWLLVTLNMQACDCNRGKTMRFLEIAAEAISGAQTTLKFDKDCGSRCDQPIDCTEVLLCGEKQSGIYKIWPRSRLLPEDSSIDVYCDMDTDGGGWTVFQKRGDNKNFEDNFFRDWESYKTGFGILSEDFWLGNDVLAALTNQRKYSMRVDLTDWEGERRYAHFKHFWIDNEDYLYTLHVSEYNGTAGDSFTGQNSMKFSTKDKDNDIMAGNCAEAYKGAWWYNFCHKSNLNGLYLKGKHADYAIGVNWEAWRGMHYSLKETEMKIRPLNFMSEE